MTSANSLPSALCVLVNEHHASRRALAFEREESRFNPLDIPLFGRSREFSPIDRED